MTPPDIKCVHRLAATELIYRATFDRRMLSDEEFEDIKGDFAALLAGGFTVGMRAKQFGDTWEVAPFVCARKHGVGT